MTFSLPDKVSCLAKPVLNQAEQELYNLCEDYFSVRQIEKNRCPVLSQVRLCDAIKVRKPGAFDGKPAHSKAFLGGVQFNALSFDIVITDKQANVLLILEADGATHLKQPQMRCDAVKDAIVRAARLTLIRLVINPLREHIVVVRMKAACLGFNRNVAYKTPQGLVKFTLNDYPDQVRDMQLEDLELLLVEAGWVFPSGWKYAVPDLQRQGGKRAFSADVSGASQVEQKHLDEV